MTLKQYLKPFAQLQLAIFLLLLIALISVSGTIIEQNQTNEYYLQTYSQQFILTQTLTLGKIILALGIDHVYTTWWFDGLIITFGTCLLSCTLLQQFPLLKNARNCLFYTKTNQLIKQKLHSTIQNKSYLQLLNRLRQQNYTIFQQSNGLYAYRGIIGRFAPIVVHIALLIVLSGTLVASLTNFQSQELIPKGEILQIHNIINQSPLTKISNRPLRVNDFWIEYGKKNNTQQFYSDLSILDSKGNESVRKTIKVNYPLRFDKLTIYQTDWNITGLRAKINKTLTQLPLQSVTKNKTLWIGWLPSDLNNVENGNIIVLNKLDGHYNLFSENGAFLGQHQLGENINLKTNLNLQILDVIPETGLQIKADPSIPLLYFGFGLLMVSTLLSYISYDQIWGLKKIEKEQTYIQYIVGGKSNRSKLNLKREFQLLEKK